MDNIVYNKMNFLFPIKGTETPWFRLNIIENEDSIEIKIKLYESDDKVEFHRHLNHSNEIQDYVGTLKNVAREFDNMAEFLDENYKMK